MSSGPKKFRRPDTGEVKDFWPDSYRNDTSSMHSTRREYAEIHCFRAADGDRIDQKKDGSFQDKWGVTWEPV